MLKRRKRNANTCDLGVKRNRLDNFIFKNFFRVSNEPKLVSDSVTRWLDYIFDFAKKLPTLKREMKS